MDKSWLSVFLPDDEYKRSTIVYFLAEASIILVILMGLLFGVNESGWKLDVDVVAGIAIIVFLFYVSGRYILSGIEYTMISTEKEYKKERKTIFLKAAGFISLSFVVFSIFIKVPTSFEEWIETFGILILAGFFMFFTSYLSLRSSYHRNKDLLDDED